MKIQELLGKPAVWAIILSQYGQGVGMIGLLSWLPTYYAEKFNVPLTSLASFTVFPYLLQMGVAVSAGIAADTIIAKGEFSVLSTRTMFQILGTIMPALCLLLCVYPPGNQALTAEKAELFITVGLAFSAFTVASVSCNHFDISPRNAGTIFAIGNTASCIGGLLAVPFTGYIYDVTKSWDLVFLIFAGHYAGGTVAWLALASDKRIDGS